MNAYEKTILEGLIRTYERSKRAKGQKSNRRSGIHFRFNEKTMPKYFSEDSYLYRDEIEATVDKLSEKGFITVKRSSLGSDIERVTLELAMLEKVYDYLGRKSLGRIETDIANVLKGYLDESGPVSRVASSLLELMREKRAVKRWFNPRDPGELDDLLRGILSLSENEHPISKRRLSVKVYRDSKRLEQLSNRLYSLFSFTNHSFASSEEMFESFGVTSTPTYVHIKGSAVFTLFDVVIDLRKTGNEWVLSSEQLPHVSCRSLEGRTVITIENYTSFSDYTPRRGISVYLAGFHGRAKTAFLRALKRDQPEASFYHFGDIDVGGLRILVNLRNRTGIDFKPYLMDKKTFMAHKDSWRPLEEHERRTLERMLYEQRYEAYRELIRAMITTGNKLEQEAVNPDPGTEG
ncbi:MAG: Wadjet anti-phage system protein JetD domain-containing protein [Acholeplasmataceae bacterium]